MLRVATSGDYAPFSTVGSDGRRGGLDVAIAERLAADLDMQVAWVPLDWPHLSSELERGAFDVVLSGVTMRPERALIGRYVRPYAVTSAVVVIRPDDAGQWRQPTDLDAPGVRVAVNAGGHLERVARGHFALATIVPVAGNRIAAALAESNVDALVTDSAELSAWPADSPRPVALGILSSDHKAPLLPVDRGELAQRIDTWLAAREQDGWLNAERIRFLGAAATVDAAGATRQAVAALIALRLGLMPDVAAAKRANNLPIDDPDREARVLERVRAQVPNAPARAAAIYTVLIEAAKHIQRQTPDRPPGPSLDEVRGALQRIDDALCQELGRLPNSPKVAWRAALVTTGLPAAQREQLVRALTR